MPLLNIYESDFRLPEAVCILAPGPNGKAYYDLIAGDWCVIAVNKAVLIREVRPDVWLINHSHQDWYPAAHEYFTGVRVYRLEAAVTAWPSPLELDLCYYYAPPEKRMDPGNLAELDDGIIRWGGTVVASALQLAYNFGARELFLCGVDMSGNEYWDNTSNGDQAMRDLHGEAWAAVPYLDALIKHLSGKGVGIYSLSPTKLNVPAYKPTAVRV
jgi:hypothetical protein